VEKPKTAKVLIVDDMDMILFVIKDQLLRYGLQVDTAAGGSEAVEKTKHNVYDLVFMDHLMPEMDGIEAAKEIRKREDAEHKHIPIIALTSNIDSEAEKMFLSAGFNGFLAKPVAKPKLEEILKKWLPDAVRP
jgi:CheY-like chemotaxis protein